MAYETYTGSTDDEQARVAYLIRLFHQTRLDRVNFEVQWEESAALVWPEYRNSFTFGHLRPPGVKYTQFQVDSTATMAAWRFMNICDALLTPAHMQWSIVRADDPALMRDPSVREYFAEVTQCLWTHRYRPEANFVAQQQQNYLSLGVFGNQAMMVEEFDSGPGQKRPGLRYIGLPPGEIYVLCNHQGAVDGFIRHFRWSARRAYSRWGDAVPPAVKAALEANSVTLFDFLQFCLPRTDYDPHAILSPKGKPWQSVYVSITGYKIMEESGYRRFPLHYGRYTQAPEESYGRGPAQQVLPEIKTLNAEKGDFLTQGKMAGAPVWLLADDLIDFKAHPNSFNFGALTPDGKRLVDQLQPGNIDITKEMMDESAKIINSAFLVDLFPLLFDDKGGQKTAREVIEAANDRGIFLAPTLGRQYGEYLGTMIDRELDLLSYQGLLPDKPPALREAGGEYKLVYASPLARALRGQPIAGFMRTVQFAQEVANITGDNSVLDHFDFDVALPEIADDQFVPPRWMASAKKIAAKGKARAQAAERERQVKELPGRAAIMKAQAIQTKAQTGGNIGGTLSGTPEGGMPMVPPQVPQGMPGQPGFGGQPGLPGRPGR